LAITCLTDVNGFVQKTKTQYIAEVELCLNKTFSVIACPKNWQQQAVYSYERDGKITMVQQPSLTGAFGESERCADTQPVAYPVIRHN